MGKDERPMIERNSVAEPVKLFVKLKIKAFKFRFY